MKISRRGFAADYGESSIEFSTPEFGWKSSDSCITIKQSCVNDFSTGARHDYTVYLSLPDVQGLLNAISEAAVSNPATFEVGLESCIKSLIRLKAVLAGVACRGNEET